MNQTGEPHFRIKAIRLVCRDVEATTAFYSQAFGCERAEADCIDAALTLGGQRLEIVRTEASGITKTATSNSIAFQHCAIVVSDMAVAMARLHGVEGWTTISANGPEKLPQTSGGVTAFKFRDPEGHPLEFLKFPPGGVPDHWKSLLDRRADDASPFLGIDHSAITVAGSERSIAFYEGLGFTVSSQQINRGPEQARMDAVDEPVIEVTGLTPPGGAPPHLELLCYRQPPVVTGSVSDKDRLATRLLLSSSDVEPLNLYEEVYDPDGHRLLMTRKASRSGENES